MFPIILASLLVGVVALYAYSLKLNRDERARIRSVEQPVPDVSLQDLHRILERDYVADADAIAPLLATSQFGDSPRVLVAILKLADADSSQVRPLLELAERDYRDVLTAAEYPAYHSAGEAATPERKRQLVAQDWEQYQQWLYRE